MCRPFRAQIFMAFSNPGCYPGLCMCRPSGAGGCCSFSLNQKLEVYVFLSATTTAAFRRKFFGFAKEVVWGGRRIRLGVPKNSFGRVKRVLWQALRISALRRRFCFRRAMGLYACKGGNPNIYPYFLLYGLLTQVSDLGKDAIKEGCKPVATKPGACPGLGCTQKARAVSPPQFLS